MDNTHHNTRTLTKNVRYNAQMITKYVLIYRRRKAAGDYAFADYYAGLACDHVAHLVRMAGEFGEALATYCTDEGVRLAATGIPDNHWVNA